MRAVIALALVAATGPAYADDDDKPSESPPEAPSATMGRVDKGTLGVGIMIGEPVGFCARLYLSDDTAIQGAVGAAFIGDGIQVHADYVIHPYILQTRESFVLATYVGPGVRIIQYDKGREETFIALGLRAVGGLLFDFKNPLDAFIEVAGVLEYGFADDEGFGPALNVGAGVRYYF
ncbi:MAG: hypothetical protein WKG01_22040 [Kofleriaceae bacterium]